MHTLVAASLFDSPWVLAIIVVVSMVSNWLMKRRQGNEADNRPDGAEPLPPSRDPEDSQRQPDLQDVLRQLLGGEPPPQAPRPLPMPPVMRDAQPSEAGSVEEPFQPEQNWVDKPRETYEASQPPAIHTAPPSPPHPALARAGAVPIESSGRYQKPTRHLAQLDVPHGHAATAVHTGRRPSSEGARAVALVRDARTVRQAYVASMVFSPPKACES